MDTAVVVDRELGKHDGDRIALPVPELDMIPESLLVIEDVADLRLLLKMALSPIGRAIVEVGDGRVAAALIGRSAPPKLVIIDRMLPFVSGDELIAMIRCDPDWQAVPILAMSAKSRHEDVASVLAAGANAYLTKPFSYQVLQATVAELIS